ncbi:phage tail tube protein [Streptococcus equi]|uniref:phage tail tube protein n=1 Tax=Streptococcus equi TaxID=1336 RepID=UPI001E5CC6A1|nr:hypothetical protein [Streptococcus equi]MCD3573403.1 hypothetical protein [Streptococcus equi subsp. equi]
MRLAGGISELEPDGNEEVSQDAYLDGSESDVTGGQLVLALTGHRLVGDKAQDWIYARQFRYGGKRRGFYALDIARRKNTVYLCLYVCNIKVHQERLTVKVKLNLKSIRTKHLYLIK